MPRGGRRAGSGRKPKAKPASVAEPRHISDLRRIAADPSGNPGHRLRANLALAKLGIDRPPPAAPPPKPLTLSPKRLERLHAFFPIGSWAEFLPQPTWAELTSAGYTKAEVASADFDAEKIKDGLVTADLADLAADDDELED